MLFYTLLREISVLQSIGFMIRVKQIIRKYKTNIHPRNLNVFELYTRKIKLQNSLIDSVRGFENNYKFMTFPNVLYTAFYMLIYHI